MCWTTVHDDLFIREILMFEPWNFKKGSPERGNCWKSIAESLNQITDPSFRVDDRSVRDRFKLLEKKYIKKRNEMDRATGIAPEEESEMEKGLREIIELFKESDLTKLLEKEKQKEAMDNEVQQAEELRLQSLETVGETSKRKGSSREEKTPKRIRRSDVTINYLREKSEREMHVRQQELDLKKAELEEKKTESERLYQMIRQQNEQNQTLLQQQQEVNLALIQFLTKQNEQK